MNVLIWGAVAMVVIGLLFARRRTRRSELAQWHRAAARMDRLCPPANDSATLWCKVVAAPSVIELPEQQALPEQQTLPEQQVSPDPDEQTDTSRPTTDVPAA